METIMALKMKREGGEGTWKSAREGIQPVMEGIPLPRKEGGREGGVNAGSSAERIPFHGLSMTSEGGGEGKETCHGSTGREGRWAGGRDEGRGRRAGSAGSPGGRGKGKGGPAGGSEGGLIGKTAERETVSRAGRTHCPHTQ